MMGLKKHFSGVRVSRRMKAFQRGSGAWKGLNWLRDGRPVVLEAVVEDRVWRPVRVCCFSSWLSLGGVSFDPRLYPGSEDWLDDAVWPLRLNFVSGKARTTSTIEAPDSAVSSQKNDCQP